MIKHRPNGPKIVWLPIHMSKPVGKVIQIQDVFEQRLVEDTADVVIVGSGASGATVARVLTEAGLDVIVVEEGPRILHSELRSDVLSSFRRMWRDSGFQLTQGKSFLSVLQGRCLGGSTAINSAIIHRIPEEIHDIWVKDYGAGEMLDYGELNRAWDILDQELCVTTVPEPVLGKNNSLMRDAIDKLGLTGNVMKRNVKDCEGKAHCQTGCPTSRRQGMDVSYMPRAIQAGARVYATCPALQIISQNGRATGIKARFVDPDTKKNGPEALFHARHAVVIAASAIQTPLILQASGIGKQSGLVGKRFQAHPGIALPAMFDQPINIWFGATQGYESKHFWAQRLKFETLGLPVELAAMRMPGFGPDLVRDLANFGHLAQWAVQVRATAHGEVKRGLFGQTVVSYNLPPADVQLWKNGLKWLAQMMFEVGAREIYPGVHGLPERVTHYDQMKKLDDLPDHPNLFHGIVSHLFGTATMGKNPAHSVVGPDLQSHEMPGLYVTDSSCFPTNMGVNPQHAICGVSWLAAERIAETFRG